MINLLNEEIDSLLFSASQTASETLLETYRQEIMSRLKQIIKIKEEL